MFKSTQATEADPALLLQPITAAQAATVSGGCHAAHACTQLYQPGVVHAFSFAMLGNDIAPPPPLFDLPFNWAQ